MAKPNPDTGPIERACIYIIAERPEGWTVKDILRYLAEVDHVHLNDGTIVYFSALQELLVRLPESVLSTPRGNVNRPTMAG